MACRTCPINQRRAFSLAEALIASTILAIAVVGIAGPLGAASEQSKLIQERATALVLARELMEEIAAKPLWDGNASCHLGPEVASGETDRSKYDSADDYNGFADSTSDLRNLSGQAAGFDSAQIYSRTVSVEYRTSLTGASTSSGDFGVVTVTVTSPHKLVVKVTRLLCKANLAV